MFLWKFKGAPARWQAVVQRRRTLAIGQSPIIYTLMRNTAIAWMLVLTIITLVSVVAIVSASSIWNLVPGNTVTPTQELVGVARNALAVALLVIVSVLAGRYAAANWRIILLASALFPVVPLALLSGRGQALCAVLALLAPVCVLGRQIVAILLPQVQRFIVWIIGLALGIGLIGLGGFALGALGFLHTPTVWALLCVVIILCLILRAPVLADAAAFGRWLRLPTAPSLGERCLIGIAIGVVWINYIGALAPETSTDATWQRLATAMQFAKLGRLNPADPDLTVALQPALGEIIYAVALSVGPLATAKLLHFIVGLCCAGAIFALGKHYGGVKAGILGAVIFYTMPLVDWLSQIAFLDLFLALFTLASALSIASSTDRDLPSAIIVGLCCGFGFVVKVHYAYIIVGIIVTFGLVLFWHCGLRLAIRALLVAAVAMLFSAGPFLFRSMMLLGTIPGLALGRSSIQRGDAGQIATLGDLSGFGFGRSLVNLVLLPLDLTLHSYRFEINPTPSGPFGGMIGYVLLASLLFLPVLRPRRLAIASLVGILVSLLLWFFTAQYLRYALSILAIFCPLAGAACIAFSRSLRTRPQRSVFNASLAVLLCAGVIVQLRVPMLGWEFAAGRESESTYLTNYTVCCSGYTALSLLNSEVGATRVLATGGVARLYTATRISTLPIDPAQVDVVSDEKTLLGQLQTGGFSHILVSRQGQDPSWDRMTVSDQTFLRRNAVLVGGDARGYLYRLLPPEQRGRVAWTVGGDVVRSIDGQAPETPIIVGSERDVRLLGGVVGANRYLLTFAAQSPTTTEGNLLLSVDWLDDAGAIVGSAAERSRVSMRTAREDIMLMEPPAAAKSVRVTIHSEHGRVNLSEISIERLTDIAASGDSPTSAAR